MAGLRRAAAVTAERHAILTGTALGTAGTLAEAIVITAGKAPALRRSGMVTALRQGSRCHATALTRAALTGTALAGTALAGTALAAPALAGTALARAALADAALGSAAWHQIALDRA